MAMIEQSGSVRLVASDELITVRNEALDRKRADCVRRFAVDGQPDVPLRISAEVRAEGVTGPPGDQCMVFFNIEYAEGPVFWDTFLYPDTGSTPWRTLSCEVRARGPVRAVEMHVRFRAKGALSLRRLRVEAIEPWGDDAECVVAIFGDSTDMTNYLTPDLRLGRRLELLLRDRFPDTRLDVHCLAEGGEYLQRVIESGRLDRELQILPRCDVAMIRYGLNDRDKGIDPAAFGEQLHAACEAVQRRFPHAVIVLSTSIPPSAQPFNVQTEAVAAARRLPVIPLETYLRERSANGDSDWHHQPGSYIGRRRTANSPDNPDGLKGDMHPNAYGAQMIAEYYYAHLEPIIADRL